MSQKTMGMWLPMILITSAYCGVVVSHVKTENRLCGTLYKKQNASGEGFQLFDQDSIMDINEFHASNPGWSSTGSIVVEVGCEIKMWESEYFDTDMRTLTQGTHSVDTNPFIVSLSSILCTCEKDCKCSDVHVKSSRCGRAYLEGGCRVCNSLYIDLFTDRTQSKVFPLEFKAQVSAFRLRKGCELQIFGEEDFRGDTLSITNSTVENFQGVVSSYQCHCNDSLYKPEQRLNRPIYYPHWVDIPQNFDKATEILHNHPLKMPIRKSYKNKRSHKNAYILVLGTSGAGKSSAINMLFDNPNITTVGDYVPTTNQIHEFRIPIQVDELGISNAELRVIDTPGLGDTRGMLWDAKFLATLDNFLTTHEELKDRKPNAVLVFHRFNDNRPGGEQSGFVKMLRGVDIFTNRIADKAYSNVIFVLSHFCSASKSERRRPENRIRKFKELIQDYTLFPRPIHIVVGENKAREEELPMVNGFYRLPNNEYYPKNLFDKLQLVTLKGGDPIGQAIFLAAFKNSENFNVTTVSHSLVTTITPTVEKYQEILSHAHFGIKQTEVSMHLANVWNSNVSEALRAKFPLSLTFLQKALNLRNVNKLTDVPRTIPGILDLMTAFTHDEATKTLLDKGLALRFPEFPEKVVAGYSYNVFADHPLFISPFKMDKYSPSDIGFTFPAAVTCKYEPGSVEHFSVFHSKEEYLQKRLQSLGIDGKIPVDKFTNDTKVGSNIHDMEAISGTPCLMTMAKDFQIFRLLLNSRLELTQEFESHVLGLLPFNESDINSVNAWRRFFDTYGTHVVEEVYGGGRITVNIKSASCDMQTFRRAIESIIHFAEDITYFVPMDNSAYMNSIEALEGSNISMGFRGGAVRYHTTDLTRMTASEASKLLEQWKESLKYSPKILSSFPRLKPLSMIVNHLGQQYSERIETATALHFKSKLRYNPQTTNPENGPGYSRDRLPDYFTTQIQQFQSNMDTLNIVLLDLKRKTEELEEKRKQAEEEKTRLQMEERSKYEKMYLEEIRKQKDEIERLKAKSEELQEQVNELSKSSRSGCLRKGTKILMADFSETAVENLRIGDFVLDKDLKPTKVLGLLEEYAVGHTFYGFEEGSYFFTANHIFVGPGTERQDFQSDQLYATSTTTLFHENPLMEFMNIMDLKAGQTVALYGTDQQKESIIRVGVSQVYADLEPYDNDTMMYDIQVDSLSGTYIANRFVCRHEIPPSIHWENTMTLLFSLMHTQAFLEFSTVPHSLKNIQQLKSIATNIAISTMKLLAGRRPLDTCSTPHKFSQSAGTNEAIKSDQQFNMQIANVFSSPVLTQLGFGIYARVGPIIAPFLDTESSEMQTNHDGLTQELFALIEGELIKHFSYFRQ